MKKVLIALAASTSIGLYVFHQGRDVQAYNNILNSGWIAKIPVFGVNKDNILPIPTNTVFARGSSSTMNERLRQHIIQANLLPIDKRDGRYFDEELANAVKQYQGKHGLEETGLPNARMVFLLNEALKKRIKKFQTKDAYISLREQTSEALQIHREHLKRVISNGGWPILRGRPSFGEQSKRVATLRKRLRLSGDLINDSNGNLFDQDVFRALQMFQWRHGLEPDGIIGAQTGIELQATARFRLAQLDNSYRRMLFVRNQIDGRYVLVNIPAATVSAVGEQGFDYLHMKAAVGRLARQTPGMAKLITSVTFNPTWTVPKSILHSDKAPAARLNPARLDQAGFFAIDASGNRRKASKVDWFDPELPFTLVQKPGASNALGRIRIDMPNRRAIFLHDTSVQGLFDRTLHQRFVSSGCVRLESPERLASWLLYKNAEPKVVRKMQQRFLAERLATKKQTLFEPVPVYLLYADAWITNGKLHFRRDTYGLSHHATNQEAEREIRDG